MQTCAKNASIFCLHSPYSAMAPRLCNLLYAIGLLIVVASFTSIPAHAKGGHAKIKSELLKLNWHDKFNSSSFTTVSGPGTPRPIPFPALIGTTFVFDDPITERASHRHVGTAQGSMVVSSFDGVTCLMSATISLKNREYFGSLSLVGLLIANATSKLPIVGGTEDFLLAQGYMFYTPPQDLASYDFTFPIDIHVSWPVYVPR